MLILLLGSSGKSQRSEGIANGVITHMSATQAVTIRRDASIRHISTERVDDKLASIREVGYGTRRRSTGVFNVGGSIEDKQLVARSCLNSIKCPIALTKE